MMSLVSSISHTSKQSIIRQSLKINSRIPKVNTYHLSAVQSEELVQLKKKMILNKKTNKINFPQYLHRYGREIPLRSRCDFLISPDLIDDLVSG